MILPIPGDAIHKMQMYRLLSGILDDGFISRAVFFKGGTCAAILGWLDRFSIDLDFDVLNKTAKKEIAGRLLDIFQKLNLEVKSKSRNELFYVLAYQSEGTTRNTLKLSLIDSGIKSNDYASFYLDEIDRYAMCQTRETMFANKLVSPIDRWGKYKTIAGRDIYDIHHFFLQGYRYNQNVIKERTEKNVRTFLMELKGFVEKKINNKILSQDLNYLLPSVRFQEIRKNLKQETILLLSDEIKRLKSD